MRSRSPIPASPPLPGSSGGRGFTLIEVIVALSAGVLVTLAAFMLSKNAVSFFQYEARVSTTQLGLTLAMNRLTNDIQRASLLSSPNPSVDPTVCKGGGWTAGGLSDLAGITILKGSSSTKQGLNQSPVLAPPDTLIIGGSMDSSEVFQVQSIVSTGGALQLVMRSGASEPATYRARYSVANDTDLPCRLKPTFAPTVYPVGDCTTPIASGRFGHIYHPESNSHWYGIIKSFTLDATNTVNVTMDTSSVTIPQKPTICGLGVGEIGGGWLFSVVTRVQYEIMDVTTLKPKNSPNSPFQPVVTAGPLAVTGDDGRTELVRRELNADGTTNDDSAELVGEYAIDLRFGITAVTQAITGDNYNPTVATYAFGDNAVYTTAALPSKSGTPQWVRGVQVRLAMRTRAPDRDTDLPVPTDGRRLRFLVLTSGARPAYARVRTSYANVALPNQGGFSLW